MPIEIELIQRGTAVLSSSPFTVTLGTDLLDDEKAFVVHTVVNDTANSGEATVDARVVSTTQIEFTVVNSTTVSVEWTVVEFTAASSVTVLNYSETGITSDETTTITATVIADTFIIATVSNNSNTHGRDDFLYPELTATTTITYRLGSGSMDTVEVQVVESTDFAVQRLVETDWTTDTEDVTIATEVVIARSFVQPYALGTANDPPYRENPSATISTTTNVAISRDASTTTVTFYPDVVEITDTNWNAIEYTDDYESSHTTSQDTITAIDSIGTAWLMNQATFINRSVMQCDDGSHDEFGICGTSLVLTNETTVDLERGSSGTAATATYKVIHRDAVAAGNLLLTHPPKMGAEL